MEFYGIEMKGPLYLEIFDIKPEFQNEDSGRLIYVTSEETLYYGGKTMWLIPGEKLVATLQQVLDGVLDNKFISPLKLNQIKALNTDINEGIDNVKYVTPAGLRSLKASIEESFEGIDNVKYVTPAGLKNYTDNNPGILPGTIIYYANNTPPSGYLKANGAAISRSTYSNLFDVIGTTFGVGDGTTTFNLPDHRGEFVRGWSDDRVDLDSGRVFGSLQEDALKKITGTLWGYTGFDGVYADGAFRFVYSRSSGGQSGISFKHGTLTFDSSRVVPESDETRPHNIALLACIKY